MTNLPKCESSSSSLSLPNSLPRQPCDEFNQAFIKLKEHLQITSQEALDELFETLNREINCKNKNPTVMANIFIEMINRTCVELFPIKTGESQVSFQPSILENQGVWSEFNKVEGLLTTFFFHFLSKFCSESSDYKFNKDALLKILLPRLVNLGLFRTASTLLNNTTSSWFHAYNFDSLIDTHIASKEFGIKHLNYCLNSNNSDDIAKKDLLVNMNSFLVSLKEPDDRQIILIIKELFKRENLTFEGIDIKNISLNILIEKFKEIHEFDSEFTKENNNHLSRKEHLDRIFLIILDFRSKQVSLDKSPLSQDVIKNLIENGMIKSSHFLIKNSMGNVDKKKDFFLDIYKTLTTKLESILASMENLGQSSNTRKLEILKNINLLSDHLLEQNPALDKLNSFKYQGIHNDELYNKKKMQKKRFCLKSVMTKYDSMDSFLGAVFSKNPHEEAASIIATKHSFGTKIAKTAQKALAGFFIREYQEHAFVQNKFDYKKFQSVLKEKGYSFLLKDLKKNYFKNIRIENGYYHLGSQRSEYCVMFHYDAKQKEFVFTTPENHARRFGNNNFSINDLVNVFKLIKGLRPLVNSMLEVPNSSKNNSAISAVMESSSHYFGPNVPERAQLALGMAVIKELKKDAVDENGKLNFEKLKSMVKEIDPNLANELRPDYIFNGLTFENNKIKINYKKKLTEINLSKNENEESSQLQ